MAYAVNITNRAARDLAQIYRYVHADESDVALRWYLGFRQAIFSLEEQPNRWPATDANPALRQLLYGGKPHVYCAIYRVVERQKRVDVLHIRHGRREHV
jgi:plasmid stabilization system protein ParE